MNFEAILHPDRLPVKTPKNVVDENGECYFGTFDKEFEKMDFLKVNRPTLLPNFMNKTRLTKWESLEVNVGNIILLTACCDMFYFSTVLTLVYLKDQKKCISFKESLIPHTKVKIADNLLGGSESYAKSDRISVTFENTFEKGMARVSGFCNVKNKEKIKYSFKLKRVSLPSVVIIPFGKNRPLYTQKDLFKAEGYIEIDGKRYDTLEDSTGIIDDHKGYYPRHSHYDWVTTMGTKIIDGKRQYFGFNLTRNQSLDQDRFNENMIWFEDRITRLPPVKFKHESKSLWHITDEYGMVNIHFDIGDAYKARMKAFILDLDYQVTFGKLSGWVMSPEGRKYELEEMIGIGEDKTLIY